MNLSDPDFEWKRRNLPLNVFVFPELEGGFWHETTKTFRFRDGTFYTGFDVQVHNMEEEYKREKRRLELEEAGIKVGISFLSMEPLGGGF